MKTLIVLWAISVNSGIVSPYDTFETLAECKQTRDQFIRAAAKSNRPMDFVCLPQGVRP